MLVRITASYKGLFRNYTLHELLENLDVVECFEQSGHACRVSEITKKQKDLYTAFGVPVPAEL